MSIKDIESTISSLKDNISINNLSIVTNGTLLINKFFFDKVLNLKFNLIQITFDGNQSHHDYYRYTKKEGRTILF